MAKQMKMMMMMTAASTAIETRSDAGLVGCAHDC